MVALRNYSGHDTPVSNPVVNEKGIVVSITLQLQNGAFLIPMSLFVQFLHARTSRACLRHVPCIIACR